MDARPEVNIQDRGTANTVTASPVGESKWALDVRAIMGYQTISSDTVESYDADLTEITASAHGAQAGDRIRFTSGALSTIEYSVHSVTTNTIRLNEEPLTAPGLDNFDILRPISLGLSSTGGLSSLNTFIRDGVNQTVTEDTVAPTNNRPLPVKLADFSGDVTVTANQLNIATSHTNDSMRLGDGTTLTNVTLAGELSTRDADLNTTLTTLDGKVTTVNTNDVTVTSSVLPSGASTSALQTTGNASLAGIDSSLNNIEATQDVARSTRASEATLSTLNGKVTTVDTNNVVVTSSVLPTGGATSANQTTTNTRLQNIEDQTARLQVLASNYISYASSNLPGNASSPLELLASTPAAIRKLQVFDTAGVPFEILTGAAAAEVRLCVCGPGTDQTVEVNIAALERVSVRRLDSASNATLGDISINFIG